MLNPAARLFIPILIFVLTSLEANAQETRFMGLRRSVAITVFAGVGGGILGLSTLSFYGNPQEHTGNITTGALLGVIGGVTYVSAKNNRQALNAVCEISQFRYNECK